MRRLSSELYPSDDELEQATARLHPPVTSTAAEARERAVVFPDVSDDKKLSAQEYALYKLRLKLKHKQTDAAFNKETKFLRTFAGGDNVPSYAMCKRIVKMEDPIDYMIRRYIFVLSIIDVGSRLNKMNGQITKMTYVVTSRGTGALAVRGVS
mmetsp:Transcript_10884/g.45317  ORF Transcript_10884/g.45317 Transcript_10884/m.45317 type:complete len:153 (-) Transcript_10884:1629-2087(-)